MEAAYDSSHEKINDVVVFYYGDEFANSPFETTPYQSIVFAWNKSPEEIANIARAYPFKGDGSYAIETFHKDMDPQKFKLRYQPLGFEYFLPNILQMVDLPAKFDVACTQVKQVERCEQADFINQSFADHKPYPKKLVNAENCTSFYAEIEGQAAGWGYLVHLAPNIAYLAGMFTSLNFRRMGAATAILDRIHQFAQEKNISKIQLVPSFMAWNFYTKRGYQTIAYFSTFLPMEKMTPSKH
jgi:GNAT superfamily N-acetyltransferase